MKISSVVTGFESQLVFHMYPKNNVRTWKGRVLERSPKPDAFAPSRVAMSWTDDLPKTGGRSDDSQLSSLT